MTRLRGATERLGTLWTSLLISIGLVAPLVAVQLVNRSAYDEDFPFVLFVFLSLHSMGIVVAMRPAVRRVRSHGNLKALEPRHWAGLVISAVLIFIYAEVIIDQLPCFRGVPNCD